MFATIMILILAGVVDEATDLFFSVIPHFCDTCTGGQSEEIAVHRAFLGLIPVKNRPSVMSLCLLWLPQHPKLTGLVHQDRNSSDFFLD